MITVPIWKVESAVENAPVSHETLNERVHDAKAFSESADVRVILTPEEYEFVSQWSDQEILG